MQCLPSGSGNNIPCAVELGDTQRNLEPLFQLGPNRVSSSSGHARINKPGRTEGKRTRAVWGGGLVYLDSKKQAEAE